MRHLGDITKINWFEVEPVDCVTGGSPCQDLSVAGKRAGLAGERSGLYMEQIRCIKELRQRDIQSGRTGAMVRPRWMVWENVPGAFSSNGGKDFAAVLEEAVRIVEPEAPSIPTPAKWPTSGCLMGGGWSIAWRVHDAQFWGVPQRRKRIALVCDFGGMSAPEVLFERKGLSGDTEQSGAEREETARTVREGVEGTGGCLTGWDCQSKRIFSPDGICATLNSGDKEGGNITPSVFFIQGNGIDRADTAGCNGKGWTLDKCHTLNTIDRPAVCAGTLRAQEHGHQPIVAGFKGGQGKGSIAFQEEIAATLQAGGSGIEPTVYDARGNGDGQTVCTLTGDHENRVTDYTALLMDVSFFQTYEERAGTLLARQYKDPPITNQNVVRRLTPLECERLQGYPDGWTDIGEWIDSKGKKHKEADSPRYKALGNSIALPFWFWLLRRISARYERPATLGSLFDGIGGFPLCWERCNGKGTALWASEIEEFPMAVTKKRFGEG